MDSATSQGIAGGISSDEFSDFVNIQTPDLQHLSSSDELSTSPSSLTSGISTTSFDFGDPFTPTPEDCFAGLLFAYPDLDNSFASNVCSSRLEYNTTMLDDLLDQSIVDGSLAVDLSSYTDKDSFEPVVDISRPIERLTTMIMNHMNSTNLWVNQQSGTVLSPEMLVELGTSPTFTFDTSRSSSMDLSHANSAQLYLDSFKNGWTTDVELAGSFLGFDSTFYSVSEQSINVGIPCNSFFGSDSFDVSMAMSDVSMTAPLPRAGMVYRPEVRQRSTSETVKTIKRPMRARANTDASKFCCYCKQKGHIKANCPNFNSLGPCPLCGATGADNHTPTHCPYEPTTHLTLSPAFDAALTLRQKAREEEKRQH